MYSDPRLLYEVRRRVLVLGESRRRVARSEGMSVNTLRKILRSDQPRRYRTTNRRRPTKLAPYAAAINAWIETTAGGRPSPSALYRWLRANTSYRGSLKTVSTHLAAIKPRPSFLWRSLARAVQARSEDEAARFLEHGLTGTGTVFDMATIRRRIESAPPSAKAARPGSKRWMEFLYAVEREDFPPAVGLSTEQWREVTVRLRRGTGCDRRVALVLLAVDQGFPANQISRHLRICRHTIRRYLTLSGTGGVAGACSRKPRAKLAEDEALKQLLFQTLHEPPSAHGLNRTSWTLRDLRAALAAMGRPVNPDVIRTIVAQAGFRWRKAREVLTSSDPDYRAKLESIQTILAGLGADERFFSVDEYGPFAVRIRGGRKLVPPDAEYTVPQWQKSRGWTIVTAALELSTNQVTHFYSKAKNTAEMIRMAETLVQQYRGLRRLYLSWDAASWHQSKRLLAFRDEHNGTAAQRGLPTLALAPLPAGAQFLNVIESVFSGMARTIIHNSDYADLDEAKAAVDRYFSERNAFFKANPKRAGRRIWGRERTASDFDPGNNCKDPAYMQPAGPGGARCAALSRTRTGR